MTFVVRPERQKTPIPTRIMRYKYATARGRPSFLSCARNVEKCLDTFLTWPLSTGPLLRVQMSVGIF